jgi:hypothetical protein
MSRNSNNTTVVDTTPDELSELEVPTEVTETTTEAPATVPVYPNATPASDRTEDETDVPDLAEFFDFKDGGSPYAIITSANRAFKALGIEKVLPTQMGYAYAKNGAIDGVKRTGPNPTKGVKFDRKTALAWFTNYVTKNLSS